MKYYLAGPMTSISDFNFPAFTQACRLLRTRGLDIASPHEIDYKETPATRGDLPYFTYIRGGLQMLLRCDAIILMDGWQASRGCLTELNVAAAVGMPILFYSLEHDYIDFGA